MAEIHGELLLTGFDTTPGDVDTWIIYDGVINDPKRVYTFYADAFIAYPWEVIFEVSNVRSEIGSDGERRLFVSVANKSGPGSIYGSYNLIWCWTDTF